MFHCNLSANKNGVLFADQFVLTIELEMNVIKYDCCIEYFANNKLTESDEYA